MSELKCALCDLNFKTRAGLWKHKNNKHNIEIEVEYKNKCKYCNKQLSDRFSKWKHETRTCKNNPIIIKTNESNITNNINTQNNNNNINTQNNIQNQNININNTINISFNALGCEDVSDLSQDEIEKIINKGLVNIIKLVELLNFHEDRPQNHTYCTTNLNNKYLSAVNTETNEIEMKSKNDIFDKVIKYALNHCDMLKEYITDKHKKSIFTDRIADLEKKLPIDLRKNKYYDELNILSYNKRKLIQQTWSDKLKSFNI
jgi:hypothetical protein